MRGDDDGLAGCRVVPRRVQEKDADEREEDQRGARGGAARGTVPRARGEGQRDERGVRESVRPVEREEAERGAAGEKRPARGPVVGPRHEVEGRRREEGVERRLQDQDLVEGEDAREQRERRREARGARVEPPARRQVDERDGRRSEADLDDAGEEERVADGEHRREEIDVEGRDEERLADGQHATRADPSRQLHVIRRVQLAVRLEQRVVPELEQDDGLDGERGEDEPGQVARGGSRRGGGSGSPASVRAGGPPRHGKRSLHRARTWPRSEEAVAWASRRRVTGAAGASSDAR